MGIIIEGRARAPVALGLGQSGVSFLRANSLWGLDTGKTEEELRRALPGPNAALSIGPAGESLVAFACVQSGTRSFGRGGAGAVMGSKNLKGIVVQAKGTIPAADIAAFRRERPLLVERLKRDRAGIHRLGRNAIIEITQLAGILPTRNWTEGIYEGYPFLAPERLREVYLKRRKTCYNCPIRCWQVGEIPEGPMRGLTSDPEYETLWAYGPACGIKDYSVILSANRIADDLGLDTMTSGQVAALIMDLHARGKMKPGFPGMDVGFGQGAVLLEILQRLPQRQGVYDILAGGFLAIKERIPWADSLAIEVKGMPPAGYDPRGAVGMALAYATSTRGACHNVGGWTIRHEVGTELDRFGTGGKAGLVFNLQNTRAYIDCLGICTEVRRSMGYGDSPEGQWFEMVMGDNMTPSLTLVGERVYTAERSALVREGVSRKDDSLPARWAQEVLVGGPAEGSRISPQAFSRMLDEYYEMRGWDSEGIPTKCTLSRLSL